ncbi:uncharacterized protein Tco025E_04697 [Trypanosoma conorhini]|uniref:CBF1-interacting co-repressor CIR N-terminal domain-containing protein n=1 Tax=Trypanosoma conorhini TaxID=83891 RepID=A0A3R7L1U4_9TRYP|nr:uncharacterized protein Tco025E_04697 [Trypanosoma conorhini]RNF17966.1 hypothetical protein Tco025E_04697 [Trypanosoma conorhini]
MYAAHKKDINRHKSFHPLTYRNLSKVEQRQEAEAAQKKAATERGEELRRDQEQRRYDDLVLAASADSVGGQLAKFRQVENIFAAEAKTGRADGSASAGNAEVAGVASSLVRSGALAFRKEEAGSGRKRGRDEGVPSAGAGAADAAEKEKKVVTGFMSTSDAAQLRKELDMLQKERHDPLRRIEQFQNRTVAAEAKRRALETKSAALASAGTGEDMEKDAIRGRIHELLQMKRRK